jgi:hypothetical protein
MATPAVSANSQSVRFLVESCRDTQTKINQNANKYREVAATILAIAAAVFFSMAVPVTYPFLAGVVIYIATQGLFSDILAPVVRCFTPETYDKIATALDQPNSPFAQYITNKDEELLSKESLPDAYKQFKHQESVFLREKLLQGKT